jgi:hypothetical protein
VFDNLFYLAALAFGLGISLATYRLFAIRNNWPMGAFHADVPAVPIMIGLVSIVVAILFAASRADVGGWPIIFLGLAIAFLWTSFLRVGSQLALFLAPLAAGLLLVGWLGSQFGYDRAANIIEHPKEMFKKPTNGDARSSDRP